MPRGQLAPAHLDPPGQHHGGPPGLLRGAGDAGDHLAAQRLPVEGALAGQQQVGGPGPLASSAGDRARARRRAPASPPAAAARSRCRRPPRRRAATATAPSVAVAQVRSAASSWSRAARSAPFCAPNPAPPLARAAGRRCRWRRPARPPAVRQRRCRPVGSSPSGPPPRRTVARAAPSAASSPAPPSVLAVPPTPTTTRRGPGGRAASDQLADAVRRRRAAGHASSGSTRCSPTARPPRRTPCRPLRRQHPRGDRVAERPADRDDRRSGGRRGRREHVDEARPAVGERQQVELVVARAAGQPWAIASAASVAVRSRPNRSGATRIFTRHPPGWTRPDRGDDRTRRTPGRVRTTTDTAGPCPRDGHAAIVPSRARRSRGPGRPDGEPPRQVGLDRQVGAHRGPHLQLEARVPALLGPDGTNG